MIKKINYIFFTIILLTIFKVNILANTKCEYVGTNSNGELYVNFEVSDKGKIVEGPIVQGYLESSDEEYIANEKQGIENWNIEALSSNIFGKDYFMANKNGKNKGCPEYAIFVDRTGQFDLYISDFDNLSKFEDYGRQKQGYQVLKLEDPELIGKQFTINFYKNNENAKGEMSQITVTYGKDYLPENKFSFDGFTPVGWMVKNNGKWLCANDEYDSDCQGNEWKRKLVSIKNGTSKIPFDVDTPQVDLYMKWQSNSNLDSQTINKYNLGSDFCKSKGFVWNETKIGNYCNIDNLTYVKCGDAYDIPSQVPELISFAVNLLKIATPIILIIVSVTTLLKAITASKEDEIKKAQNSLIRKIIAAALIFFVTSIVQFVILKVADSTEQNSISNCMSCFLNNDCGKNVYYKTAYGSEYTRTYIKTGEPFDIESVNNDS